MVWNTPITWTNGFIDQDDLNEQIRDNLAALKDPPSAHYEANEAGDYTTNSAVFTAIDGVNWALTLTPAQANATVLVGFHGTFEHDTPSSINLDIDVDGSPVGGDDGILRIRPTNIGSNFAVPVELIRMITGLSAAAHTFTLQWKTGAGNATLYAGAGTSFVRDVHPQFWVREIS